MNTFSRFARFIVLVSALSVLSACQAKTDPEDKASDHNAAASAQEPVINAKAVMDKVNKTVDTAVDTRMEQLERIEIDDISNNPDAYLAMNAKKPNIRTTDSGLQYRVIRAGTGPKPATKNTVQVHYRGTFPDGTEFDSSYKRGEPAAFPVTGVIQGWTEALLMMNEGSKWELVIPPELAYGESGAGGIIPPNQVLKFDVELLDADYLN